MKSLTRFVAGHSIDSLLESCINQSQTPDSFGGVGIKITLFLENGLNIIGIPIYSVTSNKAEDLLWIQTTNEHSSGDSSNNIIAVKKSQIISISFQSMNDLSHILGIQKKNLEQAYPPLSKLNLLRDIENKKTISPLYGQFQIDFETISTDIERGILSGFLELLSEYFIELTKDQLGRDSYSKLRGIKITKSNNDDVTTSDGILLIQLSFTNDLFFNKGSLKERMDCLL